MQLSKQQKDAVDHIGSPALVVAGAGSGKTRILTAKVAHLISLGYNPERILAITFTNKAADEMKRRLVHLTGIGLRRFPWVGTFHRACLKILKEHCSLLGYNMPLQVCGAYHQQKNMKEVMSRLDVDKKYLQKALAHVSKAKNYGDPAAYLDQKSDAVPINLFDIYDHYVKVLRLKNSVDFDDILLLTRNLLRDHQDIRNQYQKLFEFILVDEYQDTNNLQEELTGLLLSNGNLFCVGDDWQAIYGFRGSNIDHFLSFAEKYNGSKIFRLEQNYRSTNEIVQVANELMGYNEHKMEKRCFSEKGGGGVGLVGFYNAQEEADWVSRKIKVLADAGIKYNKMAVLYRTKFCSLAFEQIFRAVGIPYRMMGSKGFFERKEVLDITCYLTASVYPKDDVAFERIINVPKRGIGPGTVKKIRRSQSDDMSLQDAARKILKERVLTPKIYNALSEVIQLLDEINTQKPDVAIRTVLTRFKYLDYLQQYCKAGSMDYTSRVENIEQLIYSASQKETIHEYLEEAALVKEDKEDETDKKTAVNLSTIHASKGLEYLVVFVAACEEGVFPHWKSMDSGVGVQEERRLMYVAMTRAERHLFLSSANFRKGQYNQRSRFLDEIEESLNSV